MKLSSESGRQTTDPVPTRFFENEAFVLTEAKKATGMTTSELIRRSVRLMRRQREVLGSYDFVVQLTS